MTPSPVSLQTLKEKLSSFTPEGADGNTGGAEEQGDSESSLTALRSSLDDIVVLCHQSSQNLNQQQREVLPITPASTFIGSSIGPCVFTRTVDAFSENLVMRIKEGTSIHRVNPNC